MNERVEPPFNQFGRALITACPFNLIYYTAWYRKATWKNGGAPATVQSGRRPTKTDRSVSDEFPLTIHTFLYIFFVNEVVFGIIIEFRRFVTNIDEPEAHRRGWLRRVIKFQRSESNFMVFKLNFSSIGKLWDDSVVSDVTNILNWILLVVF